MRNIFREKKKKNYILVPGSSNYSLDNGAGSPDSLPWRQTICHGWTSAPPSDKSGPVQVYKKKLRTLLNKYHFYRGKSGTKDLLSLVWDHVMVNLGCCGSNSYLDFTNSTTWASTRSGMQVIISCDDDGDSLVICLDCPGLVLYHR